MIHIHYDAQAMEGAGGGASKILEGNKLIAEFLGWHLDPKRSLKYHSSWDWLMPVVEKINATREYDVIIFRSGCHINDENDLIFETTLEEGRASENLIGRVWPAIVRFIKWHNEQKSKL